jgi:hypothetical protein
LLWFKGRQWGFAHVMTHSSHEILKALGFGSIATRLISIILYYLNVKRINYIENSSSLHKLDNFPFGVWTTNVKRPCWLVVFVYNFTQAELQKYKTKGRLFHKN